MKKAIEKRLRLAIVEEEGATTTLDLLDLMRQYASEDSNYLDLPVDRRLTYNQFFEEVKENFMQQLMAGDFGVQIVLDTFFILCFEVGHKLGTHDATLDAAKELLERR